MTNRHLHGKSFSAEIVWEQCYGKIFVTNDGDIYLCQDVVDGGNGEAFGHRYIWSIGDDIKNPGETVQNLKVLPDSIEYHKLFTELLAARKTTWDVDGSYSVLPKELVDKVSAFIKGIS